VSRGRLGGQFLIVAITLELIHNTFENMKYLKRLFRKPKDFSELTEDEKIALIRKAMKGAKKQKEELVKNYYASLQAG
jgi:hypothetical protein